MADVEARLTKIEVDAAHAAKSQSETRQEVQSLGARVSTFENYKTILVTAGAVLGALGLGLTVWVNSVAANVGKLSEFQDSLKKVEARLDDLDKNRIGLVNQVVEAAVPVVVESARSAAQVPPGTILMWWPDPPTASVPAGWRPCGAELNGWTPQFEDSAQLLGHKASMRATPGGEVLAKDVNLSIVRVKCLVRQ